MRQTQVFSGSSHPMLVEGICDRLGIKPGEVELGKFSNGETKVQIQTSIRNQDVFIVQSGSNQINDAVFELLIMVSACKGGSAKSITAVMPYFPYSRQSKKKSHRGSITARMIANLLNVAGVNHVITLDLHASQMQGFFKCPVDNLVAEPLIARWIKLNVPEWQEAVVVSKNPGGTKRVTSLADALKLSFGIVTTDSRRSQYHDYSANGSVIYERFGLDGASEEEEAAVEGVAIEQDVMSPAPSEYKHGEHEQKHRKSRRRATSNPYARRVQGSTCEMSSSPLARPTLHGTSGEYSPSPDRLMRTKTAPMAISVPVDSDDDFIDERARDVIHGRLVHGHIVDEDFPSPAMSARSGSRVGIHPRTSDDEADPPPQMLASFISAASSVRRDRTDENALGGSMDAGASSDEEEEDLKNPELETTITLVGNVKDRPVFIVDDMIDKSGSWIAAAECCVKRGGATQVYCMATHGLFGDEALQEMEDCSCIEKIIVTNSFPIAKEKMLGMSKLTVLDVSPLLAEAIRRNHHGENISQLYMHYD